MGFPFGLINTRFVGQAWLPAASPFARIDKF
jgi:hypothetical protein